MDLLIFGAGGHGRVVKEVAESIKQFENIAFLDDNSTDSIGKLTDYPVFINQFSHAFIAIGDSVKRMEWTELIKGKFDIPVLIHPDSYVSPSAEIGDGTVVMPKAVVQANVKIGAGCIISSGAIIDHDSVVGDYCHINAGAIVPSMSDVPVGIKVNYGSVYRKPNMPDETEIHEFEQTFF